MTLTETEIQIALGTYLPEIWKQRCNLYAEGDKLDDEGYKLTAKGCKLINEGYKLIDEGHKLRDEGCKLTAKGNKLITKGWKLHDEGNLLFINAVIEVYGKDTDIQWTGYGCKVNGIEYREIV